VVSGASRAVAGLRILRRISRAYRKNAGPRYVARRIVRSNAALYRIATGVRAWLRRLLLPPLPRNVREEIARYPALQKFASKARRKRARARAFADLLATSFLSEYLNHELAMLARGESSAKRVMGYLRSLTILQTPEFALRVRFFSDSASSDIYSLQRDTLVAALGDSVDLHRYRVPESAQRDMFERTAKLTQEDILHLQPGQIAAFRAGNDAYVAIPRSPRAAMLVLEDQRVSSLSWRFNAESLSCTGAISSDPAVSRLRETLELAAALHISSIAGIAQSLLDHPSHIVRWSALAAVSRISRQAALPLLQRGARDRHPQLRRAARRLLNQELGFGADD
jgi:hypothetical protein